MGIPTGYEKPEVKKVKALLTQDRDFGRDSTGNITYGVVVQRCLYNFPRRSPSIGLEVLLRLRGNAKMSPQFVNENMARNMPNFMRMQPTVMPNIIPPASVRSQHTAPLPPGVKAWFCIYPCYIDAARTYAEGRKLEQAKCIDEPTWQEMKDVLEAAGLPIYIEPLTMHPRSPDRELHKQGRVRVKIRDENGSPLVDTLPTKKAVLKHLGEMIPKLKSRSQKPAAPTSTAHAGSSNKNAVRGAGGKKGGKKRR